mgnify:CR=1 FL=1
MTYVFVGSIVFIISMFAIGALHAEGHAHLEDEGGDPQHDMTSEQAERILENDRRHRTEEQLEQEIEKLRRRM